MGCGSCGVSNAGGKVSGCGSSGGCSSGGCNRLNVFDWLADLPPSDYGKTFSIFEVSFNNGSRKEFFLNSKSLPIEKGNYVTVEGINGFDVGVVSLTGELVKLQLKKYHVKEDDVTKKLLRLSLDSDLEAFDRSKSKEKEILAKARTIARVHDLDMKIGEVELQADAKKVSVYYTANSRVDFRELIKIYAQEFNARIEMRQIGARQESGKIGGIGSCGRELCCSTWLTDFKTVYTSAARYQNLSINQTKLSGQCGKLKCCLNYELDTYMDALTTFPNQADHLMLKAGKIKLVKKDIFKGLMWYSYEHQAKQYPLSIERVNEILSLNKEHIFPDELEPVEIITEVRKKGVSVDAGFVNDVGQITLTSLTKKKKSKSKGKKNSARTDKSKSQVTAGRPELTKAPRDRSSGSRPAQQVSRPHTPKPPQPEGIKPAPPGHQKGQGGKKKSSQKNKRRPDTDRKPPGA